MTTFNLSADYQPLPPNWHPPDWLLPTPTLPNLSNDRVNETALRKIFNPPTRSDFWTNMFYENKNQIGYTLSVLSVGGGLALLSLASTFIFTLLIDRSIDMQNERNQDLTFKDILTPSLLVAGIGTVNIVNKLANRILAQPLPDVTKDESQLLLDEANKNPLFEHMAKEVYSRNAGCSIETIPRHIFKPFGPDNFARCFVVANIMITKNSEELGNIDHIVKVPIAKQQIEILSDISLKRFFSGIVFEMANLYQMERFFNFIALAKLKNIGRNEYALIKEYIEFQTCQLVDQVMEYGISHLNWSPDLNLWKGVSKKIFDNNHWKDCNYIYGEHSHADAYRKLWSNDLVKEIKTEDVLPNESGRDQNCTTAIPLQA